jgi:hypothetical protein
MADVAQTITWAWAVDDKVARKSKNLMFQIVVQNCSGIILFLLKNDIIISVQCISLTNTVDFLYSNKSSMVKQTDRR